LTPSEGRNFLNKILENTPYTGIFDEFPEEEVDEILELENEVSPIQPTPVTALLSEPIKVEPPVENHHSLEDEELIQWTLSTKSRMIFSQTLEMPRIF
jgi:hypothetical protein